MSVKDFSFRGLMAPVFTPFHDDKNINFHLIPKYAEYLYSHRIQGILVNGTTGEGVSLTLQERKDVLETWIKACEPYRQTIMVQVGGTNMKDVKSLARHAEESNVAAILCLPDLFFRPSSVEELLRYLKIVSAEAPRTPLLYYHIPSFTGINLNMKELLERSSEVPTLIGIKFTDNDLVMGSSCVAKHLKDRVVFLGCDTLFLQALHKGFDSAIGTSINIFPHLNREILRCFNEKQHRRAETEQDVLNHNINEITKHGSWVSSMKAAMRVMTPINVGPVRDPLVDVTLQNAAVHMPY